MRQVSNPVILRQVSQKHLPGLMCRHKNPATLIVHCISVDSSRRNFANRSADYRRTNSQTQLAAQARSDLHSSSARSLERIDEIHQRWATFHCIAQSDPIRHTVHLREGDPCHTQMPCQLRYMPGDCRLRSTQSTRRATLASSLDAQQRSSQVTDRCLD